MISLLGQIAYFVAQPLSSPEDVLACLMPGVKYSYLEPVFYGFEISGWKKPQSVSDILKTHLLIQVDNELCLEPYWSVFIQNSLYYVSTQTQYHDSFKQRAYAHSDAMQTLQSLGESISGITHDSSTLLGQLNLLRGQLYINSSTQRGSEHKAGMSAEVAIDSFLKFQKKVQKKIDSLDMPGLKEELIILRQMLGRYEVGEDPIKEIDTCLATRSLAIFNIISSNKS